MVVAVTGMGEVELVFVEEEEERVFWSFGGLLR